MVPKTLTVFPWEREKSQSPLKPHKTAVQVRYHIKGIRGSGDVKFVSCHIAIDAIIQE